jgi:hypothetical protein
MNIPDSLYIPDLETFSQNQSGKFTPAQDTFFSVTQNEGDLQIHSVTDKFTFFPEDCLYGFQTSNITFQETQTEFACQDGRLLPGIIYRIFYTINNKGVEVFLSAEAVQSPTEEVVYNALIDPLEIIFDFSDHDVHFNKQGRLSGNQLKKIKNKEKKTLSAFQSGTFDFVYVGNETMLAPEAEFVTEVSRFFSNHDSVFLLNVKYRIYYESNTGTFLSAEPIEILEPEFALPYLHNRIAHKSQNQNKTPPNPFVMITTKIVNGVTIAILLFIAIPVVFLTVGMWAASNIKFGWVISICACGFGVWLWMVLAKMVWKSLTQKDIKE